jgi:hypothetical protein
VKEDYFFAIFNEKLNRYMKLTKIAMVQVLGSVEDEKTFNNLSLMKIVQLMVTILALFTLYPFIMVHCGC